MSLQSLGLIGNCQISALTDGQGGISWLCLPQPDAPSVFGNLLDPQAGHFSIQAPDGAPCEYQSQYLTNTNILRTEIKTDHCSFEVIDFCPRFLNSDRMFRPPQLFRIVRPVTGTPLIRVDCQPKWAYGKEAGQVGFGSNHITYFYGQESLRLTTTMPTTYIRENRPFLLSKPHYFVLAYGEPFEAEIVATSESFLARTQKYWRTWVKQCSLPRVYGSDVIRSALCLKLHVYEDTGAILAATTTSIPECLGQGRNWDYRYCWLRDSFSQITALKLLGQAEEVEGFAEFLANLVAMGTDRLQPVYRISGDPVLEEKTLDHLAGYRGEKPVRIGNDAATHIQNDVYGELIIALSPLFLDPRFLDRNRKDLFDKIEWLAEKAIAFGMEPDNGIWEFRSAPRCHVFTAMVTIAGLRVATRIALSLRKMDQANEWQKKADSFQKEVLRACQKSPIGIPQTLEEPWRVDATSLLAPALNIIKSDDPIFKKTLKMVEEKLLTDFGPMRYEGEDDFGPVSACFGICSFWYVNALIDIGRVQEAKRWFEKILSVRNQLGLLSEDWTADNGELWGNFPQVYSHVGLISSAMRLSFSLDPEFRPF